MRTKLNCKYCDYVHKRQKRRGGIIYENKWVIVFFGSQHHYGHTIVAWKKHLEDLTKMRMDEQILFYTQMEFIARVVKQVFKPNKLNFALLGNWTPHLHWHIYPRYRKDRDWGSPPDYASRCILSEEKTIKLVNKMKKAIKRQLIKEGRINE